MKWGVITLTKGALNKAKEIKKHINDIDIYTLPKWNDEECKSINKKLEEFVGEIFSKYDVLIFIMASGIVVRVIAKYIKDKTLDPAVLVIDEKGNHVISLLSGHLGGANDAAVFISEKIGAEPVITTASDVKESLAVDTIAMKLNLSIESLKKAKDITSMIVNDESVGIISDIKIDFKLPNNITLINKIDEKTRGLIYISNKISDFNIPYVHLIPKNIVIGIGCRKDIITERIIESINSALSKLNIHYKSLKMICTVDVKEKEKGIIETSEFFNVPIKIVNRDEIKEVENMFETSSFVKKSIGVGSVCEPCGYIGSNNGICLMKKTSFDGITLSVWEEK